MKFSKFGLQSTYEKRRIDYLTDYGYNEMGKFPKLPHNSLENVCEWFFLSKSCDSCEGLPPNVFPRYAESD